MIRAVRWLAATAAVALASGVSLASEAINAEPGGLAIQGYDTVAYFTEGAPVVGSPDYESEWQGVRWRFAKPGHLARFEDDPEQYAPRYGGFCAGAMARGWKAPVDPEAFAIVDGRLYLAYHWPAIDRFEAEAEVRVPAADENWARIGLAD